MRKKDYIDKSKNHIDRWMLLAVIALCIFGTVMVFSASYYDAIHSNGTPYYYLIRQLMWLGVGTIGMIFFAATDYHFWAKLWPIIYLVGLFLLVAVLVPGVGTEVNGATRWIYIGPIAIMPGEWAKAGLIFFMTGYYSMNPKSATTFKKGILPVVFAGGVYALLILIQPNMSTAATVIFIAAGIMLAAGAKLLHLFILAIAGAAVGAALVMTSDYRRARYLSFLDPFEDSLNNGYQVVQGLLALGSGGVFGKGIGNSVQKNLYLPEPQNDFITAIIGEELGFVGLVVLIIVYIFLIFRCAKVAMNAEDLTGLLFASGVTTMIGVQVVINLAVVTSSMPPTGVILPFISYGGNALLIIMCLMGIMLNISKHQKK